MRLAPLLALLSLASARFVFDDPFQGKIVPRGKVPVVDSEVGTLSSWRWSDCGECCVSERRRRELCSNRFFFLCSDC